MFGIVLMDLDFGIVLMDLDLWSCFDGSRPLGLFGKGKPCIL